MSRRFSVRHHPQFKADASSAPAKFGSPVASIHDRSSPSVDEGLPDSGKERFSGAPRARAFLYSAGDDYTACFRAALSRLGIEYTPAPWALRWLAKTLRRGDVFHLHWPSFLYYDAASQVRTWRQLLRFAIGLVFLRARGVRIVWTAHNLYPHDGGRAVLAHRFARRLVVALSSHVCAHGQAAAELVQREFGVPTERQVLLEHGHWIGFYPNAISRLDARRRLGIPEKAYLYLFIGLCKPYKNLEQLVLSHRALGDDSLLWVVGRFQSETYRQLIVHSAARTEGNRVAIRDGMVEAEDFQLYLNACDIVVLPYREVLTSGASMLALSFGRPVIAPRIGALQEVVTPECGILYEPNVQGALTESMRAARSMSFDEAEIMNCARRFSWDRSAAVFDEKVLRARRP